MRNFFILLVIALTGAGCTSSNLSKSGIDKIEFGSGGGFSGRYEIYSLDLKQNTLQNTKGEILDTLEKEAINALVKQLKETDFSSVQFDHPYNFSYYIQFQGKFNHKITWGDPTHPAPEPVKGLYKTLTQLIHKKQTNE